MELSGGNSLLQYILVHCISRRMCVCGRGRLAAEAVRGRVEVALEALGGLLAAVRLPAHALGPLLRACAQALTVDGLHVLQVKAVGARTPFAGEERRLCALTYFACAPILNEKKLIKWLPTILRVHQISN